MRHDQEAVWRACHVITGDCRRCPASEIIHGDDCVRGCYAQAVECINVVETGNPWRKTEGVRPPWAALSSEVQPVGSERSDEERSVHAEPILPLPLPDTSRHVDGAGWVERVRAAFRAGWYVNAAVEDQPADYLAGCEEVDWRDYVAALAQPDPLTETSGRVDGGDRG